MSDKRGVGIDAAPAYLSLGSNIGPREANVLDGVRLLQEEGLGTRIRVSPLYETEPVGCGAMRDFVNAVVELHPLLSPNDLIMRLQDIERRAGRSGGHNHPRELDIDILTIGRLVMRTEALTVPHPRYGSRSFVLVPLRDLAPGFRCPASGRSIDEMIAGLPPGGRLARISSRGIATRPRVEMNHV